MQNVSSLTLSLEEKSADMKATSELLLVLEKSLPELKERCNEITKECSEERSKR